MKDYLVKALAYDGTIRAYAIRSTETVKEVQERHTMWPTATAAVGRTMTATVMMGAMLKGEEKLTVKIEGNGPIGAIVADANAKGEVRAYARDAHVHKPLNEQGKLDVRGVVGTEGSLSVVKDIGLRDYFTGQIPLVSGEIAEDFTHYFAVSEQVPSAVGLGVLVNPDNSVQAAGGFILQVMPGATDETITALEQALGSMTPVSKMIAEGHSPEEMLASILGEENVEIVDRMDIHFSCDCSRERFARGIIGLGKQEIVDMIEEDGQAEAQCHFCLEKYHYTKEQLEQLLDEATS
ncbi:MAG TPA: Hsp33 family molecular chaperone HslO [Savagea sp.]